VRNVLVLGGTGMLSGLVLRYLTDGDRVFVVARRREPLDQLVEQAGATADRLTPIALDYHDTERLGRWLAHGQLMHGPLDQVVAWIHGDPTPLWQVLQQEVRAYRQGGWDVFHILGHHAWDQPGEKPFVFDEGCRYHRVILGAVREDASWRWLTHAEIVEGIWSAVQTSAAVTRVGVRPEMGVKDL